MAFLPPMYPSATYFLVRHPVTLTPAWFWGIIAFGMLSIFLNYMADLQRQETRIHKGNNLVWGKKPRVMVAHYTTSDGIYHENLLLYSGWWGVSRHFQYIFELALALSWCLPAMFTYLMPYTYFFYLTILLFHRAGRDEVRCAAKYGDDWKQYCKLVPWRIIPFLF